MSGEEGYTGHRQERASRLACDIEVCSESWVTSVGVGDAAILRSWGHKLEQDFGTEVSPGRSRAPERHFGWGRVDGCVGQELRDRFGGRQFIGEEQEINSTWKAGSQR